MQAYKIMARNTKTGVRIQKQFLDGHVVDNYDLALVHAQSLAEQQSARSRETWVAEVEIYNVGTKPGQ